MVVHIKGGNTRKPYKISFTNIPNLYTCPNKNF